MGNYVMRVKATPRKLADGNAVHESEYAYKPSWSDCRWNDEQERKRLGPAYRAWARKPDAEKSEVLILGGKAYPGATVYRMDRCAGAYNDGRIGDIGPGAILQVGTLYRNAKGKLEMISLVEMDELVARNSAFKGMNDLLSAGGNYRPSIDVRDSERLKLANVYDSIMEARGDARRAYRYGGA